MQILGIKEHGIKKYQAGTQRGGIQPQSEEGGTSEVVKEIVKGMIHYLVYNRMIKQI